jgi:hypothetical protein
MNLTKVANKAAKEASVAIGATLSESDMDKFTAIIAKAMEDAVREATKQHSDVCTDCLDHDQDLAHKIQREIERKKKALISNLSSLR